MNAQERRAGLRRLGLIVAGLISSAFLIALVFANLGAPRGQSLAAGSGLVGVALVVGGVVAFGRTSAIRRTAGLYHRASADERKEAERLALGLFGLGIAFSAVALVLG